MLKIIKEVNGIVYNNKLYLFSANDLSWLIKQNRVDPIAYPARNLKSLCYNVPTELES